MTDDPLLSAETLRNAFRLLASHLGLTTAIEVLALAERVLGEPVVSRKRMIVEDLFPS